MLSLISAGGTENMAAAKKAVQYLASITSWPTNSSRTWAYLISGLAMTEYYLATGEEWVRSELREIYDFLIWSQYTSFPSQVNFDSNHWKPKDNTLGIGGWGHNAGFEGYGPIGMPTGMGGLVFSLMQRCGISVNRSRHQLVYDFMRRSTDERGFVWYTDYWSKSPGREDGIGRTGASAIANWMSLYSGGQYREDALRHARCLGDMALSFPDTHASPTMGCGFIGLGAFIAPASFRKVMDANRWWFSLAQTHQGTFYQSPGRQPYGEADTRFSVSAAAALIFLTKKRNLWVTGKGREFEDWVRRTYPNNMAAFNPWGDVNRDGRTNWRNFLDSQTTPVINPNPASFAVAPRAISPTSVTMTATAGSSSSGAVQYRFVEMTGNPGGNSSSWQSSRVYTDHGLNPNTFYAYQVQMRVGTFAGVESGRQTVITPPPENEISVIRSQPFSLQSGWGLKKVLGLGSFDAHGADKLIVVVSTENGSNDASGAVLDLRYNNRRLVRAAGSFVNQGSAEIWYLDNPGPIGSGGLKVSGSAPNGGVGCVMAVRGTRLGVGAANARGNETAKVIALRTRGERSLVVSAVTNSGNPNHAGLMEPVAPLTKLHSAVWGNGWASHSCGYMFVESSSTVKSFFTGATGSGYSMNLVSVEFLTGSSRDPEVAPRIGDVDGDGVTDQTELIFGLNPEDPEMSNPHVRPLHPINGTFQYTRLDDALTGYEFRIFTSTDLKSWSRDFGAVQTAGVPNGKKIETVTVTISRGLLGRDRRFVKVVAIPKTG